MGLDVPRFFKLTLDNVYRFVCSVAFFVAVFGAAEDLLPSQQLSALLEWLGAPNVWVTPAARWISERDGFVAVAASLLLIVAVAFASANTADNRSGSTALLAVALLCEAGRRVDVQVGAMAVIVAAVVVTGATALIVRRTGGGEPEWLRTVWAAIRRTAAALLVGAVHVLSPLGWLISQEPRNERGSRDRPLYVEQVRATGPTGARPTR